MSSTTEPEIKQLSPGTTLVRHEDTETNAVVYTVNNSASDVRWRFTLDFRTSKNFTLLKNATTAHMTTRNNVRRIIVAAGTTLEVARLTVTNLTLESSLQLSYAWEEQPPLENADDDQAAFATFGKPVHKKEALSTDVDLLTTRTDLKDGHTKFVYRIKSRRRESLKIILDFTGSTNLAICSTGLHNRLKNFVRSSSSSSKDGAKNALVKEMRVTKGTTRVAKLRTTMPRQGWALNHNVTFEMKELRAPLVRSTSAPATNQQTAEKTATPTPETTRGMLPARPKMRRISVCAVARNSGFESGVLPPFTPPMTPLAISKKNSKKVSFQLMDSVCENNKVDTTMQTQQDKPSVSRMSWLDADIFQMINGNDTPIESTVENNTTQATSLRHFHRKPLTKLAIQEEDDDNVKEMLVKLKLDVYYQLFVDEAFDSIALLHTLAMDSKTEFRTTMKDLGIEKAGHREQILRHVIASGSSSDLF